MRYASLAFRTLFLLDLVSSSWDEYDVVSRMIHLISLNPPQSQNTFLPINDHSANDIILIPLELGKSKLDKS